MFIDFYYGLVPLQTNGCDCGIFVCLYAYNLYSMRDKKFTKSGMQEKFRDLITRSPAFQFTMDDISRTREEIKTLVDSLSVLYKHVQQKDKQVKTTADSLIDKMILAFVTCDKCHGIFDHYLKASAHEELCTLDYKPGTAILDEDFVNRWT